MRNTPIYNVWRSMIKRCESTKHPRYKNYGGRGIKVCPRWRLSFEAFYADMGDIPLGLTLDRIESDGDYEPGNCRWASWKVQGGNKRSTIWVDVAGARVCFSDAAIAVGTTRTNLNNFRKKNQLTHQEAVDFYRPMRRRRSSTGTLK